MTFKVTVVYQIHDGKIMTKEIEGVEKIERAYERIGGDNTELIRIHTGPYCWHSWAAGSILTINMVAETGK